MLAVSPQEGQPRGKLPPPWTPALVELLKDWKERAERSSEEHYALASRLARANIRFGVPVVALATFVGTSVFATLQRDVHPGLRIGVGMISVLAAVLASLQTFLRFGERAERHRAAAELWASIRRELDEMLALHAKYLAAHDPKEYLDGLRRRIDGIAKQSPEMGERGWWRPQRRYEGRRAKHEPPGEPTHAPIDGVQ